MALVMALALILVLGAFGFIVTRLTSGARREVDVLGGHLRALSVADACYAEVISRLSTTGWQNRWFRGAPDVRANVIAAGGQYSYVLRDTPGLPPPAPLPGLSNDLTPGQADLMVKASYGKSETMCVWRLVVPQDGLDEASRVVPTAFSHVPDPSTSVTPGGLDSITTMINEAVKKREKNRNAFERNRARLRAARTPVDIATTLGFAAPGDVVPEPAGRPSGYVDSVVAGDVPPPAPPATAAWTEAPWRKWRNGGDGKGERSGPSDRKGRGDEKEKGAWDDWPGWKGKTGQNAYGSDRQNWDNKSQAQGGYNNKSAQNYDNDGERRGEYERDGRDD